MQVNLCKCINDREDETPYVLWNYYFLRLGQGFSRVIKFKCLTPKLGIHNTTTCAWVSKHVPRFFQIKTLARFKTSSPVSKANPPSTSPKSSLSATGATTSPASSKPSLAATSSPAATTSARAAPSSSSSSRPSASPTSTTMTSTVCSYTSPTRNYTISPRFAGKFRSFRFPTP